MTQPGYRHRILVMDRSGSIDGILAGQQSGLAEFFKAEAQVPGNATYSLWDFDDEIRCVHSFASREEVRGYQIEPRGLTAMYDAVGDAVETEGTRLAELPEDKRPEDVTVIIASDGLENASRYRSGSEVRNLLAVQQDAYKWRVIYMGTNQDAFKEGGKIGTRRGSTVNYVSTNDGAVNTWQSVGSMMKRAPLAAASVGGYEFTDDERELAESAEKEDE